MDAYERSIIRGIYQAACMGDRKAMRILESLTTKRRRNGKCAYCGKTIRRKINKYCSMWCSIQSTKWKRTAAVGPRSKLSESQILEIRRDYAPSRNGIAGNLMELASKYGVSRTVIYYWAKRKKASESKKQRDLQKALAAARS